MNLAEAAALVKVVTALCPSQALDQETPTAWEMALYDITATDAMEAVRRLSRRETQPGDSRYIEPGHVRGEVARIRAERIANHPPLEPPADLSPRDFLDWQRRVTTQIGDGQTVTMPEIPARPMPDLSGLVKRIDE